MMDATTLAAVLKAVQTATSVSNLSTLLVNSLGVLVKTGAILIQQTSTTFADLNDVTDWRIAVLDTLSITTANAPVKANGMILVSLGTYHVILRAGDGGQIYFRAHTSSTGWQPWKTVSMVGKS